MQNIQLVNEDNLKKYNYLIIKIVEFIFTEKIDANDMNGMINFVLLSDMPIFGLRTNKNNNRLGIFSFLYVARLKIILHELTRKTIDRYTEKYISNLYKEGKRLLEIERIIKSKEVFLTALALVLFMTVSAFGILNVYFFLAAIPFFVLSASLLFLAYKKEKYRFFVQPIFLQRTFMMTTFLNFLIFALCLFLPCLIQVSCLLFITNSGITSHYIIFKLIHIFISDYKVSSKFEKLENFCYMTMLTGANIFAISVALVGVGMNFWWPLPVLGLSMMFLSMLVVSLQSLYIYIFHPGSPPEESLTMGDLGRMIKKTMRSDQCNARLFKELLAENNTNTSSLN